MFDSFQNFDADVGNGKPQQEIDLRQDIEALSQSVQQLTRALSMTERPNNTALLAKVEDLQTEIAQALKTLNRNMSGYDNSARRLGDVERQMKALEGKIDCLEEVTRQLNPTMIARLDWKVLMRGLGMAIIAVAVGTTITLRIFPPGPDAFVSGSLKLIFDRVEKILEQTKP
jgi:DNA repair exonuclease SbcCD ATPase subunit